MTQTADSTPWTQHYPAGIRWDDPVPQTTLPALFAGWTAQYAGRPCLSFMGRVTSYAALADAAARFARGLQNRGVKKGDRVGLCLPNSPFYVIAYFGALQAGAVVVNFNPLYAEQELSHQIDDSGCTWIVTINVPQVLPKVEKMPARTCLRHIVCCDLADALPAAKGAAFRALNAVKTWLGRPLMVAPQQAETMSFNDLVADAAPPAPVDIAADDLAVLQYTGGTTGVPKGAALSHGNLTANLHQAKLWFTGGKDAGDETMLAVLPFFHVFSMTVQMNLSLHIGAKLVMLPKFELKETLKTIAREKPTMFAGVPTLYKAIVDCPDIAKYDLSSLRVLMAGGAAMAAPVHAAVTKLTGLEVVEGYGLSETSPIVIANPLDGKKKIGSIGMPLPATHVRMTALENPRQPVPQGAEGEICLKGPQVMKGYWNKPEETAKSIDEDGYFHTGDVGYIDEDGYIFIVDRIKDMINASGMKVFPRKVEEAILQHPDVSETIVLGVEDDYRGETVKAFVVLRAGKTLTLDGLTAFLKDKVSSYERPKLLEIRQSLPKTMIGKPDKKALAAEEKEKAEKAKAAAQP